MAHKINSYFEKSFFLLLEFIFIRKTNKKNELDASV